MWRNRDWALLLNLIDHLPSASHTRQAMGEDEEHVDMVMAALGDERKEYAPPAAEYDAVAARLDKVVDQLKVVVATQVAVAGGKPQKIKPEPRPETAAERVLHKRKSAKHQATVNRVLGRRSDG